MKAVGNVPKPYTLNCIFHVLFHIYIDPKESLYNPTCEPYLNLFNSA